MPLKVGPIDGHTVMLDAQSDPECIWIMCSCGEVLNVNEPPSGDSLKESIKRVMKHLGEEVDFEEVEKRASLFDALLEEEGK